jgi:hypothetical protein
MTAARATPAATDNESNVLPSQVTRPSASTRAVALTGCQDAGARIQGTAHDAPRAGCQVHRDRMEGAGDENARRCV